MNEIKMNKFFLIIFYYDYLLFYLDAEAGSQALKLI